LELIGGVSLPLSADTILTNAVHSRVSNSGEPRSGSEGQMLIDQLGGSPQFAVAVPLIVRGKVVAVLYGDSSSDSSAINSDALEVLVRVASMAVSLSSVHRAAPETHAEPVAAKPEPVTPEPEPATEITYAPQVEARLDEPVAEPVSAQPEITAYPEEPAREEYPSASGFEVVPEPPSAQFEFTAPEPVSETPAVPEPEVSPEPFVTEAVTAEPAVQPVSQAPAFSSGFATPLGSSRRFGITEPELPIEVSDEERRLHNDARRFARLLVSEIKLYNEPKVREGRSNSDLYDRLREDIDRSRQMYDKRVAPPVAARHDYFHQELVNMLAEGDPAKLGGSYPGAVSPN
jgi:hypothetical protein